jgi:hypothetical protein
VSFADQIPWETRERNGIMWFVSEVPPVSMHSRGRVRVVLQDVAVCSTYLISTVLHVPYYMYRKMHFH